MRVLFRLLSEHQANWKRRIHFLIRYFSQWLVFSPKTFCVIGLVQEAERAALLSRIKWFYGHETGATFTLRTHEDICSYRMEAGSLAWKRRAGRLALWWSGVVGKILVLDYNDRWGKLDSYFHYKVFIINWRRDFRTSSWRFAASVTQRPFRNIRQTWSRLDSRPRSAEVVVVGNGPSAYRVFDSEFAEMDVMVCNSAIKSRRLLSERRVVALGFIDAAFYIGPSAYCEAFFAALSEAVGKQQFAIYVDFEHEANVRQRTPTLGDNRLFSVFLDSSLKVQPNFKNGRLQRTSHSVFTSLLLPLAATYYSRIHLVGFDGKDPSMKNYFWKHNDEFQFNDLLPTVREENPGFFHGRDYEDYNKRNADEIEEFVSCVEATGVEVIMSHASFIEPLQRRYLTKKGH